MRFSAAKLMFLVAMILAAGAARGSVAGKYSDGKLTVEISDSGGACSGTFTLNSQQFPVVARSNGNAVDGAFKSGNDSFDFKALLDADTLTLTTGGKTYALKRVSAVVNPLGAATPANPLAAAASGTDSNSAAGNDVLAGYTVVAATDAGKSLVTQKAGATSIQSALEATFPDLALYFGARPKIGSAYEDARDHKSGGATFTAKLNGQEVRGIISCKMNDQFGATVAVIYGRSNATKAQWDALTTPPQSDKPAADDNADADKAGANKTAADAIKALGDNPTVYQFPDGTGSITLAAGWKTQSQSALDPIFI
jgi:hypothetical protein